MKIVLTTHPHGPRWWRLGVAVLLLALGACTTGVNIGPNGKADLFGGIRGDIPIGK